MIMSPREQVYLATGVADMRKSINTLTLLVEDVLALELIGPH
ncbi:TPA: IS66 family insertion sequence element accessory protein TnpB [Vibrio alginolyticus]|nr:IS66 family insertion sequence element accessory protein TnpB [Vibrio sp. Vb2532]EKH9201847.1 IS66 family insertion sequence element accessory protein TnpB [Vibrio parahaemolyticus]MDW1766110.1 IS66 family insertion sequence element accessory protein TnpB [Vibrio sp. Vb2532]